MLVNNQVRGYTVLVLSAIVWGTEAIMVKLCYSGGFTVAALLAWRYLMALPIFALVVVQQKEPLLPPKELLMPLLRLSTNIVAGVLALYTALALLPATLAILFFYAYPACTSLLHIAHRKGSLGAARLIALVLSAVGLILLYWSSVDYLSPWGVLAALAAAALQAFKLFRTAALLPYISSYRLNLFNAAFTVTCAGIIYIITSLLGGGFGFKDITGQAWFFMLVLGMVVTVLGNLFMTLGIHYVGAVDTSLVLLLEPLTTAILAYLIFGDLLGAGQMLGGLLILLAVALPTAAGLRRKTGQQREKANHDAN